MKNSAKSAAKAKVIKVSVTPSKGKATRFPFFDFAEEMEELEAVNDVNQPTSEQEEGPKEKEFISLTEDQLEEIKAGIKKEADQQSKLAIEEVKKEMKAHFELTLQSLGKSLEDISEQVSTWQEEMADISAKLILSVTEKITGVKDENQHKAVLEFCNSQLSKLHHYPKLQIALCATTYENSHAILQEKVAIKYRGTLEIIKDEALGLTDCSIRWPSGSINRSVAQIKQELTQLLAQYNILEFEKAIQEAALEPEEAVVNPTPVEEEAVSQPKEIEELKVSPIASDVVVQPEAKEAIAPQEENKPKEAPTIEPASTIIKEVSSQPAIKEGEASPEENKPQEAIAKDYAKLAALLPKSKDKIPLAEVEIDSPVQKIEAPQKAPIPDAEVELRDEEAAAPEEEIQESPKEELEDDSSLEIPDDLEEDEEPEEKGQ
jgi:flagellar biosynthesis/type III secretory pathway protein FliH